MRCESTHKLQNSRSVRLLNNFRSTYEAFVREFATNEDNRDRRCLYSNDDVADLDALLNRTRRRRTHARHHQTQIMARASQRNEDRAAILLHNNPLPQLAYDVADDLSPAAPKSTTQSNKKSSDGGPRACRDASSVPARPASYRCVFLTETRSSSAGSLSTRRRELHDACRLDQRLSPRSCTSSGRTSPVPQPAMITQLNSPQTTRRRRAGDEDDEPAAATDDVERWQPLTLAALMDYKTHLSAPGRGTFALGHVRLWPVR